MAIGLESHPTWCTAHSKPSCPIGDRAAPRRAAPKKKKKGVWCTPFAERQRADRAKPAVVAVCDVLGEGVGALLGSLVTTRIQRRQHAVGAVLAPTVLTRPRIDRHNGDDEERDPHPEVPARRGAQPRPELHRLVTALLVVVRLNSVIVRCRRLSIRLRQHLPRGLVISIKKDSALFPTSTVGH